MEDKNFQTRFWYVKQDGHKPLSMPGIARRLNQLKDARRKWSFLKLFTCSHSRREKQYTMPDSFFAYSCLMNSAMLSMTPPAFVCFCRIWGARADMENVNPCRKECREHFLPSWPYIENTTRSMHNWRRTCVLYLIEKVPPIDGADELLTVCDVQHLFYISLNALGSCCLGRHQLTCKNNNRSNKNVLLCEGPCRLFKNCEEWALHDRPRYWSAVENSQSRPWLEPSETESSTFLDFYNLAWSRDPIGYSSGLPVGKDQLVGLWSDQKMFPQTTSVNPGT